MNSKILQSCIVVISLCFSLCGYGQGKVTRQTQQSGKSKKSVIVTNPDGYINGHGYIDLGLPSGTKWATCNVGASKVNDYGEYYAWGEVKPKSEYTENNSLIGEKNLGNIAGNPQYDAATYNWGSNWQIPKIEHFEELKSQCKWAVITYNGVMGHKVTGPNGKSLFLPCGGSRRNSNEPYLREGKYLTSDHDGYGPKWFHILGDNSLQSYGDIEYYAGRSIRAVVR